MIKSEVTSHHVERNRGIYTITSETILKFNGSEEIEGYVVRRYFSDFRRLHWTVGSRLGLHFDFTRLIRSSNSKSMKERAVGLSKYLQLLLKRSFAHGGNNKYHREILDFLEVDFMKSIRRRSSLSSRMSIEDVQSTRSSSSASSNTSCMSLLSFLRSLIILIIKILRLPFAVPLKILDYIEGIFSFHPPALVRISESPVHLPTIVEEESPPNTTMTTMTPAVPLDNAMTKMTPAAKEAYDFLNPLVASCGCIPLLVIPPGAVTQFTVEVPGPKPTVAFKLDQRYRRFIDDFKPGVGAVTFDVTFCETIRGTWDNGALVNLEGGEGERGAKRRLE